MKLQTKMFVFVILCSLVPLAINFILSFRATTSSLAEAIESNVLSQATEQFENLQNKMDHQRQLLTSLSKLRSIQNVATGDLTNELQQDLDSFLKSSPSIYDVSAVNLKGRVVAATMRNQISSNLNNNWEFEGPKLGIVIDGQVDMSKRLSHMVATHSMPIYDSLVSNKLLGVLIGSIDWDSFKEELSKDNVFGGPQSQQRQLFLESLDDDVILYSTEGVNVPAYLIANADVSAGLRQVELNNKSYKMLSIDSHSNGTFRNPNWRLHILIDHEVVYSSLNELKHYFQITGALTLLVVLGLVSVFSRSIVQPVRSLVSSAKRLSAGDYSHHITNNSSKDEIGQLTNSFNTMREAIQSNQQELVAQTNAANEAARLKGEFLANMSHEVRTPINGVLGMTELLLNTPLDNSQARYASTISRSGVALLSVINDILDFSKIEAGKLELSNCEFDLREAAEDVVEMLAESAHKKNVQINLKMDPGCHTAYNGDSTRLRQVLINLLSNAIKFTDEGEVALFVEPKYVGLGKTTICFRVSDTGVGIEKSSRQKIFESFVQADGSTTRQFGGTGLGLSISATLVDLMGGKIGVDSELGKGSTFWFTVVFEAIAMDDLEDWQAENTLDGKHALVVEKNQSNWKVIKYFLEYWGVKPVRAINLESARSEIASLSGDTFDAVLVDSSTSTSDLNDFATFMQTADCSKQSRLVVMSPANLDEIDYSNVIHGQLAFLGTPVRQLDLFNALCDDLLPSESPSNNNRKVRSKIELNSLVGHVLLAEDNPVNQGLMLELLKLMGLTVDLVINGEEAVKAVKSKHYDLVLMDCQMPVLDGFEATASIRAYEDSQLTNKHLPIIALTANAFQGDRKRCVEAGMDDYLSKPVSSKQLKETLGGWLQSKAPDEVKESEAADINEFNTDVFSELLAICEKAPAGFYEKLVVQYQESSTIDIEEIKTATTNKDCELLRKSAHRLKSSTSSWGASELVGLLQKLEDFGRQGQFDKAATIIEAVERGRNGLLDFLSEQQADTG